LDGILINGETMHIPDGYLGPYTYIALWIIMIPIWYYAGRKLSSELKSRQVPLLALAAAFSFVIMMFNVPIPGGSTGHAVGAAIIGIVLGPWAAVIAISVALVLQALMFGDGGITAIAANCFNMAVVMPFVAYYAYKLISTSTEITSSRRVIAAAIAGYISLAIAAAFTGFEFGIQPMLHHTAEGVPLYMPYSLGVTVPAMVLEHVFGFSLLEALITALIFAYIQRTDTTLLYGEKSAAQKKKKKNASTA
jgi:cobalt/nickel transport system permease protein